MLCNRTVLPFTVIKPAVGCNPVMIIKNLNYFSCNLLDIWEAVVKRGVLLEIRDDGNVKQWNGEKV